MFAENNVRVIRKKKGIRGAELARRTGIAEPDISRLERGQALVHPGWRKRISEVLGVPEQDLFPSGNGLPLCSDHRERCLIAEAEQPR